MVKKFLDERDVHYDLRNVTRDRAAAEEFRDLGGRLPPLIVIGGRIIHGFQPMEIEAALDALPTRPPTEA